MACQLDICLGHLPTGVWCILPEADIDSLWHARLHSRLGKPFQKNGRENPGHPLHLKNVWSADHAWLAMALPNAACAAASRAIGTR